MTNGAGGIYVEKVQNTAIGGATNVAGDPPGNTIFHTKGTRPRHEVGTFRTTYPGNREVIVGGTLGPGMESSGLLSGSMETVTGGLQPGEGNVISSGVLIEGYEATGNVITGNHIGVDTNGTSFGNPGDGIRIEGDASGNSITNNKLWYNGGIGVNVVSGIRNAILGNSIYLNGGLGIDLGGDGKVTPNDPVPDNDVGPNNLQNFPVITSAMWSSGNNGFLDVMSRLESTPNTWFTIEWFGNNVCDPSDYGEGEMLLLTYSFLTNGFGVLEGGFGITPYARPPSPFYITATATDPDGNTSEFSQCRIVDTESDITGLSPNSGSTTGGGSVQITGRNFLRITQVLFGSTPATSFRVVNPDLIIATVPPRAAGVVDVRVSGVHGLSPIRPAGRFTYHGGTAPGGGSGGLLLEEVFEGVVPALLVPVLPRDSVPRLVGRPTLTEQPVAPPPAPPALAVSAFAVVPWEATLRPLTAPTANREGWDALAVEGAFAWQDGDVSSPALSSAWAPDFSGTMARDAVERLWLLDGPQPPLSHRRPSDEISP